MSFVEQLIEHAYLGVFLAAFLEFIGVPIPSLIILLSVGALADSAELSWFVLIGMTILGAVLADLVWFTAGRHYGTQLLGLYCKVSLGTHLCTARTELIFEKHGLKALLVAKFVPGLSTFAAPMAGRVGTSYLRFIIWDGAGTLIWAAILLGSGSLLKREEVALVQLKITEYGEILFPFLVVAFALTFAFKLVRRWRKGPASPDEILEPHLSKITLSK